MTMTSSKPSGAKPEHANISYHLSSLNCPTDTCTLANYLRHIILGAHTKSNNLRWFF